MANTRFFREILTHAPRYFGASAISAAAGMLMTKYYTRQFDPAAYGVLALYVSLSQYLQSFMGLSFDAVAQRVYFEYPGEARPRFLGTVLIFLFGACALTSLLLLACMSRIDAFLGGGPGLFLLSVGVSVAFIFANFLSRIAYNEKLSPLVARQTLIQAVLNHGISVFAIAFVLKDVASRQFGLFAGYLGNLLAYVRGLRRLSLLEVKWEFDPAVFRKVWGFAIPSFTTLILGTSFSYVDRILLNHYHGKGDVGVYSLGYTIATGLGMVTEAVSMALFPNIMIELKENYEKGMRKLKQVDAVFCLGLLALGLICLFSRHWLVALFSNKSYARAADVLPFITFGYVVGGGYKVVSSVLSFHGRVWYMPIVSILAFGFGGCMNWLLIPRFNEIGAGYATFLGLFAYSYIQHLFGSRYYVRLAPITAIYAAVLAGVTLLFFRMTGLL